MIDFYYVGGHNPSFIICSSLVEPNKLGYPKRNFNGIGKCK